jgi:acyl-CoA thioester hydrolase
MKTSVTWRGQVPAWQCDAVGRWNPRFAAGALDDANRVAAAIGASPGPLDIHIDPSALPDAGELLIVESHIDSGTLVHTLKHAVGGAALASATTGCDGALDESIIAARPGTIAGPLGPVNAWECDVMRHMNVQFYTGRLTEAEAFFSASLGRGQPLLRPVEHRFRYLGEMRAGDVAVAEAGKLAADADRMTLRVELRDGAGRGAASMESDLCFRSAEGEAVPIPAAMRAALDRLPAVAPARPVWSAGDWFPDPDTLARMTVLGRQEVLPWELDHTGVMPPRFLFARMASSVPFLLSAMGLDRPYMTRNGFGRAAVGYRLRYLRWPREGDCLELRSGVGEVTAKSWRFRHGFVDIADGALVCVVEAVIVLFSMTERRSVALPDDIRTRAENISI